MPVAVQCYAVKNKRIHNVEDHIPSPSSWVFLKGSYLYRSSYSPFDFTHAYTLYSKHLLKFHFACHIIHCAAQTWNILAQNDQLTQLNLKRKQKKDTDSIISSNQMGLLPTYSNWLINQLTSIWRGSVSKCCDLQTPNKTKLANVPFSWRKENYHEGRAICWGHALKRESEKLSILSPFNAGQFLSFLFSVHQENN